MTDLAVRGADDGGDEVVAHWVARRSGGGGRGEGVVGGLLESF